METLDCPYESCDAKLEVPTTAHAQPGHSWTHLRDCPECQRKVRFVQDETTAQWTTHEARGV